MIGREIDGREGGTYEQRDQLKSVHPALDEIFHGLFTGCFVCFVLVLLGHWMGTSGQLPFDENYG